MVYNNNLKSKCYNVVLPPTKRVLQVIIAELKDGSKWSTINISQFVILILRTFIMNLASGLTGLRHIFSCTHIEMTLVIELLYLQVI